ncbi:MAG TPA: hypothetical protein ENH99_00310 [Candidatus Pacearchaeota archaeon]|nr:hypothetical protein [Candidatus Pacearchaeota archaeon]
MSLPIDFGDPALLATYVRNRISNLFEKNTAEAVNARCFNDGRGGLIYRLFEKTDSEIFSGKFSVNSLDEISSSRAYFDAVQAYVQLAKDHARSFDFGLFLIVPLVDLGRIVGGAETATEILESSNITRGPSICELNEDSNVYEAGIGDVSVDSPEKVEKFLKMIGGDGALYGAWAYQEVKDLSSQVYRKEPDLGPVVFNQVN